MSLLGNFSFEGIRNFAATAGQLLPWLMIGILILAISWVIMQQGRYNINGFFARILADGRKVKFTDKARKIKTKNGIIKWKWRKMKLRTEPAPEDVQELSMKGKIVVEGYLTKENSVVWRKDNTKYQDITQSGFKPVTNDDRRAHAYEMEQAYNHLQGILNKYGPVIIAGFTLVIILVCFMVFFGKIIEPSIKMQESINAGKTIDLKIIETLERIDSDIQVIKDLEVNAANNQTKVST